MNVFDIMSKVDFDIINTIKVKYDDDFEEYDMDDLMEIQDEEATYKKIDDTLYITIK